MLLNKQFGCLELFNSVAVADLNEELPLSETFPKSFSSVKSKNYIFSPTTKDIDEQTFEHLSSLLTKLDTSQPTTIVIDNLSTVPTLDEFAFLSNLINFADNNNTSLAMVINREITDEDIVSSALNQCDVHFEVRPNQSGYSQEVDGQVNVTVKKYGVQNEGKNLRYKEKENDILFYSHLSI